MSENQTPVIFTGKAPSNSMNIMGGIRCWLLIQKIDCRSTLMIGYSSLEKSNHGAYVQHLANHSMFIGFTGVIKYVALSCARLS